MDAEESVPQQLAHLAATVPNDVLMTYLDTGEVFTNREVHERALLWASALRRQGIGAGDSLCAMLAVNPDAYFEWLGTAWLKALEVSINIDYRGASLVHAINNAQAETAIVSERFLDRIMDVSDRLTMLKRVIVPDSNSAPEDFPWEFVGRAGLLDGATLATDLTPPTRSDIACIVYTSGTTGASKGVIIPWGSLVAPGPTLGPATGRDFRLYSAWTLYHTAGKFALGVPIMRGGSLIFRERWRTSEFWNDIRKSTATCAGFLGGVSNFIMSQPERPDDIDNTLTDVLMAPVIPEFKAFEKRFGLKIHTGYAQSEIGIACLGSYPLPNHRVCGTAVPGCTIRLTDDNGNEVGTDTVGEAWIRHDDIDNLCRGYLNMPEKTAESMVDGWFRTGDCLMQDKEGNYYYRDRIKDCIRRRGENISSFEVENEVNAHPDILESAAVEVVGEDGDGEVMIIVIRHPGSQLTEAELIAFLEPRMPRYMVPRFVEFAESLPKTHTNRTRKVELRNRGIGPATWDRTKSGASSLSPASASASQRAPAHG